MMTVPACDILKNWYGKLQPNRLAGSFAAESWICLLFRAGIGIIDKSVVYDVLLFSPAGQLPKTDMMCLILCPEVYGHDAA